MVTDRERARRRLAAQDAHLRVCRELHELAPLTVYYRGGLLDVPLGMLPVRGRWAA